MVRHRDRCLWLLFALPGLACTNGHEPGEPLGTFSVTARLASTTCGQGALGATDPWQFEVKLARFERELYWQNGREDILGTLEGLLDGDSLTFRFDTRIETEVLPAERGRPACVIQRKDHAEGRLKVSGDEVLSFKGSLTFEFRPLESKGCAPLVGVDGGFEALPCAMTYSPLVGTRTDAPER